ncbi:hypothetical protein [Bradyrhizobium liaoningense]|uniref:hypothetical protein n=1 Tax=Bradyrhizobium liaoningense TaxID=43992 RepID=UPI001BAD4A24|nr:hypothetical protein [Bradyrhizobium liaoningense]MBR0856966.1 hypothetical protein [Bradyrhizobium liaoningense]
MRTYATLPKVLALGLFALSTTPVLEPIGMATSALAASPRAGDAQTLLTDMHRALATIVVAYEQIPAVKKTRADALMLESAKETATELGRLKTAMANRQPQQLSLAMRRVSEAVGRLQGTYRMAAVSDRAVAEGVRALFSGWAAFSARYALAKPAKTPTSPITSTQLKELRTRVASLEADMQRLRSNAQHNKTFVRDVDYVYLQIERLRRAPITIDTYQSTMLTLAMINGTIDGYAIVSHVYYPEYYESLRVESEAVAFYRGYWSGYYDGYYGALADNYYDQRFDLPTTTVVNIDNSLTQRVDVYVEQDLTVLATDAGRSAEAAEALAPNAVDIANQLPAGVEDPAEAAGRIAETLEPAPATPNAEQSMTGQAVAAPAPGRATDGPDAEPRPDARIDEPASGKAPQGDDRDHNPGQIDRADDKPRPGLVESSPARPDAQDEPAMPDRPAASTAPPQKNETGDPDANPRPDGRIEEPASDNASQNKVRDDHAAQTDEPARTEQQADE